MAERKSNPTKVLQQSVLRTAKIAEDTYEVSFRVSDDFRYKPGHYISVTIPELKQSDPRGNRRDFSIASSPNDKPLTIAIRDSDSGFKKTLLEIERLTVEISGPFGTFTLPEDFSKPIVLIAGGIGVTPFMSMLTFVTEEKLPYKITLLYVNRNRETTAYVDRLRTLAQENRNITIKYHYGHLSADIVQREIQNLQQNVYLVSGPPTMVIDTQKMLMRLGVTQHNIKTEEFSGYKEEVDITEEPKVESIATILQSTEGIQQVITQARTKGKLGEGIEGELSERSLSDLEALLQALSNTALVSETNAAGTITFANDKFVEISKYSREELIGQNHRILKSGLHSKEFYENMWATITRGKLWRGLFKNKAKDGSFYWVDTSIAPILGPDRRPVKYISVRFPITERQQAEEELQERAKQQNVLTILSQDALANPDISSLFETAATLISQTLNIELCAVLRLQPNGHELEYETGIGFKPSIKGKNRISAIPTASMAGLTLAQKTPVVVEDLSVESRFVGSPFLHDHGVVSGVCVIIHGTENPFGVLELYSTKKRIFIQEDINFIQAVANLLANAARNQLDKRKDEFLGIASHELKTPLTSIKTFTQLMQINAQNQNDEQSLLFLSKIDNQLNKLTDLIGDLLDISRINAGKVDYKDERFLINDVINEVVQEQQLAAKKHKITLQDGVNTYVYGDKDRISQVITNLLTNAIKYSPKADEIKVSTKQDKDKITVSVQDFGVGVPKNERDHIFDRFYQGNGLKRNRFPGGLGLGLYISAEIVKRHNGQIWVESEEGKGSTFSFSLPSSK